MTLVVFTGGVLVLLGALLWALCKAAGEADRRIEQRADRLAEVAHLGEYRWRRDARNGIRSVGRRPA